MNEEFDPPFLSEVRFGTFMLVLMPLAFLFAGIVALHLGVFYNTEADQLWAMNSRRAPDATSSVPLDDSTYVSIERDRCHGWCPAYTPTLYGSGATAGSPAF